MNQEVTIIGGGAAGFFAAITCASQGKKVLLLEKTRRPLAKVRISGGGRCNVTHSCFDVNELVKNYPRGHKALKGPFSRFQPQDTIRWFSERNVRLKTEADGRMFPITDSSETIINCLMQESAKENVKIALEAGVDAIEAIEGGFCLQLSNQTRLTTEKLLIATGSTRQIFSVLETLGHTIVPPVPSLFTFNIAKFSLVDLAGVSVPSAKVSVLGLEQLGPLLITHWGFSGPAVLKLSSFGARLLHDCGYKAEVSINWLGRLSYEEKQKALLDAKAEHSKKQINNFCPFELSQSLFKALLTKSGINHETRYADLSKRAMLDFLEVLHRDRYQISGQTTYKEEFVTCGGVLLDEVNFKTMESRKVPGLYFAGEVLDIDGITGGFNFQNAWTTGYLAGSALAN